MYVPYPVVEFGGAVSGLLLGAVIGLPLGAVIGLLGAVIGYYCVQSVGYHWVQSLGYWVQSLGYWVQSLRYWVQSLGYWLQYWVAVDDTTFFFLRYYRVESGVGGLGKLLSKHHVIVCRSTKGGDSLAGLPGSADYAVCPGPPSVKYSAVSVQNTRLNLLYTYCTASMHVL